MKIVQALWFNKGENKINYNAGWLDVKYHLMSWAMSFLSIKKYTNSIELITDSIGYDLLFEKLGLSYSSINLLFDNFENKLANEFWALKKVYSYSIHDEPFIFVDGDVYGFNPTLVNNKELLAQNFEKNFSFYHPVQFAIKEACNIAGNYLDNKLLDAINTGVIGGKDYNFFKKFKNELFEFTYTNETALHKIINDYHVPAKYINVWLEQFFLYSYAKYCDKKFSFYLEDQIAIEDDYRSLANFTNLPSDNNYLHLMHLTKVNPTVCEQLAQRLFIESPETYERVENVCRELKSSHHFIDNLPSSYRPPFSRTIYLLGIILGDDLHIKGLDDQFQEIKNSIESISNDAYKTILLDSLNYENSILSFRKNLPDLSLLKRNWKEYSIVTNRILLLSESDLLQTSLKRSNYSSILESEWNWTEQNEYAGQLESHYLVENLKIASSYYETVLYIYIHENIVREHLLDAINMLILDALENPTTIASTINIVTDQVLMYQPETNKQQLADLIVNRIRHFLYHGILEIVA